MENLEYTELESKLELRFGKGQSFQNHYSQFTYRKQRFEEDLTALRSREACAPRLFRVALRIVR